VLRTKTIHPAAIPLHQYLYERPQPAHQVALSLRSTHRQPSHRRCSQRCEQTRQDHIMLPRRFLTISCASRPNSVRLFCRYWQYALRLYSATRVLFISARHYVCVACKLVAFSRVQGDSSSVVTFYLSCGSHSIYMYTGYRQHRANKLRRDQSCFCHCIASGPSARSTRLNHSIPSSGHYTCKVQSRPR